MYSWGKIVWRTFFCSFLGLAVTLSAANAMTSVVTDGHNENASPCTVLYYPSIGSLERVHSIGSFRIYYSVTGEQSIFDVSDKNKNNVPDYVEDLALQLDSAHRIYTDAIGLIDPLDQPRYKNAKHINVFVMTLRSQGGLAFDEVIDDILGKDKTTRTDCAIRMYISNSINPSVNATPSHELFHLYQYGYAMFKRSGYLEGMARLMEGLFSGPSDMKIKPLNFSIDLCADSLSKSYAASLFLRRVLASLELPEAPIPEYLLERKYSNERPVFAVQTFVEGRFIKEVLESLALASKHVSKEENLPFYQWPEKLQKSDRFDRALCGAMGKAYDALASTFKLGD